MTKEIDREKSAAAPKAGIVSEQDVHDAVEFLRSNAHCIGHARRRQIYTEKYTKHVEAILMKMCSHLPVSAQAREARADDRFLECVEAEAEAAGEFERLKCLREAASATIEVFRTESANARGMKL